MARTTSVPPAVTLMPTMRTRLPGLRVVASTLRGPRDTGLSSSIVSRTVNRSGSGSNRSTSRPIRAVTGPP